MKATYRIILDLTLEATDDADADGQIDSLFGDGPQLGSEWAYLKPELSVNDVERTS